MATRSLDFRYIFANGVGLGLNDNEIRLMFSFCEDLNKPEESIEQVGIILTPRTAKLVARMLSDSIEHFEGISGVKIPFDEEKFDALKNDALVTPPRDSSVDSQP